jgi:uncharacterized membrane protein YjfL (UPF0719 family)
VAGTAGRQSLKIDDWAALPGLPGDIKEGKLAPAIFLAALSIAIGVLNAAAMSD